MKDKGQKYVNHKLHTYSSKEVNDLVAQKEVFFDALAEVKTLMLNKITEESGGHASRELLNEVENLQLKYDALDDALRGVIKTVEYEED